MELSEAAFVHVSLKSACEGCRLGADLIVKPTASLAERDAVLEAGGGRPGDGARRDLAACWKATKTPRGSGRTVRNAG